MKQDTLAGELESLMCARQACKTEAAADTMTHEIGLLVCGHPETILAALRTDGEDADLSRLREAAVEADRGEGTSLRGLSHEERHQAMTRTDGEANSRAVPSGEAVERVAETLANDAEAREIADQEGAAAFDEMEPTVQDYWRALARAALSASKPDDASALLKEAEAINDIAVMMAEFVDNWPPHKKFSTSLKLIAKTFRALLDGTDAETDLAACERAIDRMGWPEIHAFMGQPGQSPHEDAGGFMLRKIKTLFGIKPDRLETYREAARRLVNEARIDASIGRDGA